MNPKKLKGKMAEYGDRQSDLAKAVGVSPSRLNAKINEKDGADFTGNEIKAIIERYGLTDREVIEIFFA